MGQLLPVRHSAESDLRVRSLSALERAGLSGITVDFTGQDGVVTGTVMSTAEAQRALDIVRGLEGVRIATSRLIVAETGDDAAAPSETPAPAAPTAPSPATVVIPHRQQSTHAHP